MIGSSKHPASKVAAVVATAATFACGPETVLPPTLSLVSVASVPAPLGGEYTMVLLDHDLVCVTDYFEFQVHCIGRDGVLVGVFGREGEGPGEFALVGPSLFRRPDGTVGAASMNRFSIFTPTGDLLSEAILPVPLLVPASKVFDTTLTGQYWAGGVDMTPVEIDVASGVFVWHREDIDAIAETECGRVASGIISPSGGWTFPACQRELVFLDHRDAPTAKVIQSPTYSEEFPSQRDIADIAARNRSFALQTDLDVYRETPKRNHMSVALAYDDRGRLWVATRRDRDRFSYFDLYVGTAYVGSVQVKDRLLGYDLYGSTLAVLVERPPDADGISARAVDWYDIDEVDLGL